MIYTCLKNHFFILFKHFTIFICLSKIYIFLISLFNSQFYLDLYFPHFTIFLQLAIFSRFLGLPGLHYFAYFIHISYTTLVTRFHRFTYFIHFPYTPLLLPQFINCPHFPHILHTPINFLYIHKV
jgi:hypothetical protein